MTAKRKMDPENLAPGRIAIPRIWVGDKELVSGSKIDPQNGSISATGDTIEIPHATSALISSSNHFRVFILTIFSNILNLLGVSWKMSYYRKKIAKN